MKLTKIEIGQKYGFHERVADRPFYDIRGTFAECVNFAREKNLTLDIHRVSGSYAPADTYYGRAY